MHRLRREQYVDDDGLQHQRLDAPRAYRSKRINELVLQLQQSRAALHDSEYMQQQLEKVDSEQAASAAKAQVVGLLNRSTRGDAASTLWTSLDVPKLSNVIPLEAVIRSKKPTRFSRWKSAIHKRASQQVSTAESTRPSSTGTHIPRRPRSRPGRKFRAKPNLLGRRVLNTSKQLVCTRHGSSYVASTVQVLARSDEDDDSKCREIVPHMALNKHVWTGGQADRKTSERQWSKLTYRRRTSFTNFRSFMAHKGTNAQEAMKSDDSDESKSKQSRSRRRGSFLMLGQMSQKPKPSLSGAVENGEQQLPEDKLHWLTSTIGPSARAAALHTERLQYDAAQRKVRAENLRAGLASKLESAAVKTGWNDSFANARLTLDDRLKRSKALQPHLRAAVARSTKKLHQWRQGFLTICEAHDQNLNRNLLARDLHKLEMSEPELYAEIVRQTTESAKIPRPDGSCLPTNQPRVLDDWDPSVVEMPDTVNPGPLTSMWSRARMNLKTQTEVAALGESSVRLWQAFCVLRAGLEGRSSSVEDQMALNLKRMLEDGETLCDDMIHDLLSQMGAKDESNKRIGALLVLLRQENAKINSDQMQTC